MEEDRKQGGNGASLSMQLIEATSKPCPSCKIQISHYHGHGDKTLVTRAFPSFHLPRHPISDTPHLLSVFMSLLIFFFLFFFLNFFFFFYFLFFFSLPPHRPWYRLRQLRSPLLLQLPGAGWARFKGEPKTVQLQTGNGKGSCCCCWCCW
jgi:hypothetical protein